MIRAAESEKAFVLHRRRQGEKNLVVDFFSQNHGRIACLAPGGAASKSGRAALLQPFALLAISWRGRGELPTLGAIDLTQHALKLTGQALYCGYYLNELLTLLLPANDAHDALFQSYHQALIALANVSELELTLRRFEQNLLTELGLLPSFEWEADGETPIDPTGRFNLILHAGFARDDQQGQISGVNLLNFAQEKALDAKALREIKWVMRRLIDDQLVGRALKSRELFKKLAS